MQQLDAKRTGHLALISGDALLSSSRDIFFGFDEFYVLDNAAYATINSTLPKTYNTSDRTELRTTIPDDLHEAFSALGAVRYASDGCGLNVISTRQQELAAITALLG